MARRPSAKDKVWDSGIGDQHAPASQQPAHTPRKWGSCAIPGMKKMLFLATSHDLTVIGGDGGVASGSDGIWGMIMYVWVRACERERDLEGLLV